MRLMSNVIMKSKMTRTNETLRPMFARIVDMLVSAGVRYDVIEHKEFDGTASNSSEVTGTSPEQGAKSLVMMVDQVPIIVVVRGTDRVSTKKIKKATRTKNAEFPSREQVTSITGIEPGSIPPLGELFDMKTYVDEDLLKEEMIAFGTGLRTKTIVMRADDFRRVSNPVVGDFANESK